ncbi:MAG TPA: DoxX family protein [Chitinophagaceae bacterium]|nr:DoxX family protein [Chitinophagaceae bacterium]
MISFSTVGIWILRLLTAIILLQTLYFKFSAAPESIYIFSRIGMEPWGRIGTGILELIGGILILIPATTVFGASLAIALMAGAIFFHVTKLGISVQNDGGQLFIYALVVFISSVALVIIYRSDLAAVKRLLTKT